MSAEWTGLVPPPGRDRPAAATLLLHGGRQRSDVVPTRFARAALRMRPLLADLRVRGRRHRLAAHLVRYRSAGWNDGDALEDTIGALAELRRAYGDVPVCLIGHSMGARAALRAGGEPNVRAICALAPWVPEGEPVAQLAGRPVLIVLGARDRVVGPVAPRLYARRAAAVTDLRFVEVARSGHAMLARAGLWHLLVRQFAFDALDLAPATLLPVEAVARL